MSPFARAVLSWTSASLVVACGGPLCPDRPRPGEICLLAGTGELGFNRDGLPPGETDFYLPSAVRRAPDGRLLVMDFNNMRLRELEGDAVRTVAGNGFHAGADVTVDALDSPLENPIDFAFDPEGRVVLVSYHDPRVLRLSEAGTFEVLAGTGDLGMRGDEGDFDEPRYAQFIQLDGIAITPEGTIYVSDSVAHRVRRIDPELVQTVAGTGRDGFEGDGGPGTSAQLSSPTALALTPTGELLIADTLNHAVRRLDAEGTITTIAGDGTRGFSGDGGPATSAQLDQPNGLAVAPDGTVYIADRGNFRVRRLRPDGTIDTIAGTGQEGLGGDGGPALEARLGYVARIALDGDVLLVADQSNGCLRRLTLP